MTNNNKGYYKAVASFGIQLTEDFNSIFPDWQKYL
jgi:hypothetical protein